MATGEIDHLADIHTGQICPAVYDHCSRAVVTGTSRHRRRSLPGCGSKLYHSAGREIGAVEAKLEKTLQIGDFTSGPNQNNSRSKSKLSKLYIFIC